MPPSVEYTKLSRVLGRDKTAKELLEEVEGRDELAGLVKLKPWVNSENLPTHDYAQVDPSLSILEPTASMPVTMPETRVGYAGLTPQQRYRMVNWLSDPLAPAPRAIRQIYVAHLETNLFDTDSRAELALDELCRLLASESWHQDNGLARAALLGLWLQQNQERLDALLSQRQLPDNLVGIGLGQLAILGGKLTTKLLGALIRQWNLRGFGTDRPVPPREILELRLMSLVAKVGGDPLASALAEMGENANECRPWRCTHRDLRIEIPHPNLAPTLKPLIEEALDGMAEQLPPMDRQSIQSSSQQPSSEQAGDEDEIPESEPSTQAEEGQPEWTLVLEFGHSRSEYFDFAIFRARQRSGYTQIMDEDRTLIHRVVFTKSEMRSFWLLWEYVQNWSSTRVYVNGTEIEKWKVWPYSQYLR